MVTENEFTGWLRGLDVEHLCALRAVIEAELHNRERDNAPPQREAQRTGRNRIYLEVTR